jgi:hypothetical protein
MPEHTPVQNVPETSDSTCRECLFTKAISSRPTPFAQAKLATSHADRLAESQMAEANSVQLGV